jgi:hypothetical protein
METWDAPALLTSCARRESSTHAPQALEMLNGTLSNELAEAFAARLLRETDGTPSEIVERAFQLALARGPTSRERELSLAFLDRSGIRKNSERSQTPSEFSRIPLRDDRALREFALAMFNLNGFVYVP